MDDIEFSDIRTYSNFDDIEWATIRLSRYREISNLILVTPLVFIADIDCVNGFTKKQALAHINNLEHELNKDYRVYETYKGYRLIDTQETLDLTIREQRNRSIRLLERLYSDSKYIYFCEIRKKYAARLSPKQNRPDEFLICKLVKTGATPVKAEIETVVKLHDSMCWIDFDWCDTWRVLELPPLPEPPEEVSYNPETPFF